jgi:hemerythrin
MALMEWYDHLYSVRVEVIDDQHKKLVSLINELHAALQSGKGNDAFGGILKELVQYIDYHFKSEEELMTRINYPALERHRELHKDLTRQVAGILMRLKKGQDVSPMELLAFLKVWLIDHIGERDRKIGEYLRETGKATDI